MKNRIISLLFLALTAVVLQGCIAFPPLIQVEHKDAPANTANTASNQEVLRRLDSIDRRLNELEQGKK